MTSAVRVAGETGQVVRACVHIDPSDPLFAGHYPGFPILPGLYVVDHVDDAVSAETGLYLAALDRAKFVAPVRPGDDLRIEAILTGNGEDVLCAATVFTDSGVVAELRLRYQATRPGGES